MSEEAITGSANPEPTFREVKQAQLREERPMREQGEKVREDSTPDDGTLDDNFESSELDQDESQLDEEQGFDDNQDDGDLDNETLAEADEPEDSERYINLEKRLKDSQRKITELTEGRDEYDREQSEITTQALQFKHQLEDKLSEAQSIASITQESIQREMQQMQQAFSTGLVPPDQMDAARNRYQQLTMQHQHIGQQLEARTKMVDEANKLKQDRDIENARFRLKRTIPNWSEDTYGEIASHAKAMGYSDSEVNGNYDYRFIEMAYNSMQYQNSANVEVGVKKKGKPTAKPNRNARQATQGTSSRLRKARRDMESNPNQRGRPADYFKAKLRNEQRGR